MLRNNGIRADGGNMTGLSGSGDRWAIKRVKGYTGMGGIWLGTPGAAGTGYTKDGRHLFTDKSSALENLRTIRICNGPGYGYALVRVPAPAPTVGYAIRWHSFNEKYVWLESSNLKSPPQFVTILGTEAERHIFTSKTAADRQAVEMNKRWDGCGETRRYEVVEVALPPAPVRLAIRDTGSGWYLQGLEAGAARFNPNRATRVTFSTKSAALDNLKKARLVCGAEVPLKLVRCAA